MFENNSVQPYQQEAFNNYTKMLPAFQTASDHYKKEETVILSQIQKFKKTKLKATKKENNLKEETDDKPR